MSLGNRDIHKFKILESHLVTHVSQERLSDYAVGKFHSLPSRKSVKKAIKRSFLLVNQEPSNTGYWVKVGDVLTVILDETERSVYERELEVIFEDDHIAGVHKPGDLPVSGNTFRTLQNALLFNLKPTHRKDALEVPRPVHRLDRQTSGVILIAKTRSAVKNLGNQFEARTVDKTYLACVCGKIDSITTISDAIDGKEAITEVKAHLSFTHKQFGELTLIEAKPKTGRTNQIRIHLSNAGFPILGDLRFGGLKSGRGLFLFAHLIKFYHPSTQRVMTIKAVVPRKFEKLQPFRK
ncbi:MAG: RluA family pseudouridine synthase [Flavobacteriales bacterium]|nr:RluA family pseudouridine synthase [Flavobacteriales bacterium]